MKPGDLAYLPRGASLYRESRPKHDQPDPLTKSQSTLVLLVAEDRDMNNSQMFLVVAGNQLGWTYSNNLHELSDFCKAMGAR